MCIREVQLGLLPERDSALIGKTLIYRCRFAVRICANGAVMNDTLGRVSLHVTYQRQRERSEYSLSRLSRQARRQLRGGSAYNRLWQ